jgi:hypothetical protein
MSFSLFLQTSPNAPSFLLLQLKKDFPQKREALFMNIKQMYVLVYNIYFRSFSLPLYVKRDPRKIPRVSFFLANLSRGAKINEVTEVRLVAVG